MSFTQSQSVSTTIETSSKSAAILWFIWGTGAIFYCYAYFLRISPSVMMDDLIQHFHITAAQIGNLSAFYYYAYTPMQLPVGLIIDRFGARLVLALSCLICLSGLLLFISADALYVAQIGRFLIGFGSAFAYITSLKLATIWLPANRFATAAGLTTAFGMTAAIFSDHYLTDIVAQVGYRNALYCGLMIGIGLFFLIVFMVRNKPKTLSSEETQTSMVSFKQLLSSLWMFMKDSQMWLIGIVGCLLYLPASVFLDLWGITYLKTVYNLSADQAANAAIMVFIGWIIASPLFGMFSDKLKRRKLPLLIAAFIGAILMSVIFYMPNHISTEELFIMLFILGMSLGSHPLCFSLSRENTAKKYVGTATAATNFLIMMGGVIFQPFVGWLLDKHWDGVMKNGVPFYTIDDYTYALSVIPIGLIVSFFLLLLIKETHCRFKDAD